MSLRQIILVIDDDSAITDALSMLLDRDGRTIISCSDVESAELVLGRYPVTHILSDVQFSGPFGFEGLHFLTRIRAQRAESRIVLMTGHVNPELRGVSLQLGADALLSKPFQLHELEAALQLDDDAVGAFETFRVPALDEVLRGGMLTTVFQPIVALDRSVFGFEALTRTHDAWPGGGVIELFEYAAKRQRLADLNLAAIQAAVTNARALPGAPVLFINVDPMTFAGCGVADALRSIASRNAFPLSRIVIELTERSGFGDFSIALHELEQLRQEGVRFALDDHGSAYSHLSLIDQIRPSFIKISHTFGTGFDEDAMRTRVVRHISSLARDFGCRTVLEGVESEQTARAAAELGIDLVQGYHFGRPQEASRWIDALRSAAA
jgi:EAL domain-containing protein (putative c-di-GMP-specific phosphodiesterase class I)